MRILVTGAAGLIGSGVAARLAGTNDVIGLDLNPGEHVRIVADCGDVAEWRQRIGPLDAIVHVAALHVPHVGHRTDDEFRRTNVEATARLLDFAVGSRATHFVLTSTTSLYGHALEPDDRAIWVDESLQPQPRDIYDETKLEAWIGKLSVPVMILHGAEDRTILVSEARRLYAAAREPKEFIEVPSAQHVQTWFGEYRGRALATLGAWTAP